MPRAERQSSRRTGNLGPVWVPGKRLQFVRHNPYEVDHFAPPRSPSGWCARAIGCSDDTQVNIVWSKIAEPTGIVRAAIKAQEHLGAFRDGVFGGYGGENRSGVGGPLETMRARSP